MKVQLFPYRFIPLLVVLLMLVGFGCTRESPAKLVVLTFDDAVRSHRDFVAPLLQELGFGATFFISYAWMQDTLHFMNWDEVAELDSLGFEIGNHSWTHSDFSQPKAARELEGELIMMEWVFDEKGIDKPVSYAHTGNSFGPEVLETLDRLGYRLARRGKSPEVEYGSLDPGPGFDPDQHHPLLIPTTIDFYPDMSFDHFRESMLTVTGDDIIVLQFHGVPDLAHPWVDTPPEAFERYMNYLKDEGYEVIAMRDLMDYLPVDAPEDPLLGTTFPNRLEMEQELPAEVQASRDSMGYWMEIMKKHEYTEQEIASVLGISVDEVYPLYFSSDHYLWEHDSLVSAWPFPGGRHPRIDFQEGMMSPMRGTELSVFLPWDQSQFVVLDLPEAIFSQFGLTFLGHKHIPTVFDWQQITITNQDWQRDSFGVWTNKWELPQLLDIDVSVTPHEDFLTMSLAVTNKTTDTLLTGLQTQICVMLGQTEDFHDQSNDNKMLSCPVVAVESRDGDNWILTGWQGCTNPWGNTDCPCMHADPVLPDCPPGETVAIEGVLSFYTGTQIQTEIRKMERMLREL